MLQFSSVQSLSRVQLSPVSWVTWRVSRRAGGRGAGLVAQSCPTLETPWTVAHQAPLSIGFSRQAYWSGLPFPSPRDLPNPGVEPRSPALQADSLPAELLGKPKVAETGTVASPSLLNIWCQLKSIKMPQNSSVFQNV